MREHKSERKSAGSRPEARKAKGTVIGRPREREGICRWKALRIGEAALVDARVVEAVLAFGVSLQKGRALGATWSVRGRVTDPARGRERRAREALPARGARLLFHYERRDVGRPVRSWSASSNAASPEVGSSKGGPAPRSRSHWANARCASRSGHHGASCGLGSRAKFGCSYRTSVAEIGETHLPSAAKVSREVIRGGEG
jgi:hypothetical protein